MLLKCWVFVVFYIFFCKKFLHLFLFFAIMDITPPLRSGSVKTPGGVSYGVGLWSLGFLEGSEKTFKKVLDKLRLILLKLISRSSMRLQTNI